MGGHIFEPGVSAAATIEICQGIHAGIDVYVPCCKYQVNLLSSPWFPVACTVAITHRNHFFCLNQFHKFYASKLFCI